MTPRENFKAAVTFQTPRRLPRSLPDPYGSDVAWTNMHPSTDTRPDARSGPATDEWGAVWVNIGVSSLGEVKTPALADWADFDKMPIPDVRDPARWELIPLSRQNAPDKFLIGQGVSLYERVHFIRGLQAAWMDIYENTDHLLNLIEILTDMNLVAIEKYKEIDCDGIMFCDDWGLQDRLMIQPEKFREIWKPFYARVYKAAHDAGMLTLLHSCGEITSILGDLVEAGLDVIQMDQQENMGLDRLRREFGGTITFWCPVDIQQTMARGNPDEIRAYVRKMVSTLGRPEGGFICGYYGDRVAAGHTDEAVQAMCEEFMAVGAAD